MTRSPFSHHGLVAGLSLLLLAAPSHGATPAAAAPVVAPSAEPAPGGPVAHPAEAKFWRAVNLFQEGRVSEQAAAQAALRDAVDAEYSHAEVLMGNCLLAGSYGYKRNPRKGAGLFRLAANRGNGFAQVSLGQCYFSGDGVARDRAKAATWLEAALRAGADFSPPNPPAAPAVAAPTASAEATAGEFAVDQVASAKATAHFLLGLIARERDDLAGAHAHFVAAADPAGHAGLYPAAVQAALGYAFGQGVPRDMAKATAMLEQGRRLGLRTSLSHVHNNVALRIANDLAAAEFEEQLAKSMEQAQAQLQFQIAQAFGDRKSKDYNPAEAARWYQLAADSGQVWAMLALADQHLRGELGAADPGKAFALYEKAGGGDQPRHPLGVANLAICLHRGIGTAPDPRRAAALFAKYGDTSMTARLGSIGQVPARPATLAEEQALVAAGEKKGDAHALYLRGRQCRAEADARGDIKKAAGYFKRASKAGHAGAWCELGLLYEYFGGALGLRSEAEARAKALECYRKSAALNNTAAMANLANCIDDGWTGRADPGEAEKLYRRCLELEPDHGRAFNNLGGIYERRLERELKQKNEAGAAALRREMLADYEAADRLGFAYAARNLGRLHLEGTLVPQDHERAYRHFSEAADRGLAQAHRYLGEMHEKGLGVPVTLTEAAYHYRQAALDGDIPSLRRLAVFYTEGIGVAKDTESASFWLVLLARRGEADALVALGDLALQRDDHKAAFKLFDQLRQCPDWKVRGRAWERLSRCYENGWGVARSAAKAQECYQTAVTMGNPQALYRQGCSLLDQGKVENGIDRLKMASDGSDEACVRLAELFLNTAGPMPDAAEALRYLRRAAGGHNVQALLLLARTTLDRLAGAPSLEEALRLANEAESRGEPRATPLREELEKMQAVRPESESEAGSRAT